LLLMLLGTEAKECGICKRGAEWQSETCPPMDYERGECSIYKCINAKQLGFKSPDCDEYLEGIDDDAVPVAALVVAIVGILLTAVGFYVLLYCTSSPVVIQQKDIQQLKKLVLPSWKNVSGATVQCRSEPDMEKKASKKVEDGETVIGVVEGEWLKTNDGLYLPMVHPTSGASLFAQLPTTESANDPAIGV